MMQICWILLGSYKALWVAERVLLTKENLRKNDLEAAFGYLCSQWWFWMLIVALFLFMYLIWNQLNRNNQDAVPADEVEPTGKEKWDISGVIITSIMATIVVVIIIIEVTSFWFKKPQYHRKVSQTSLRQKYESLQRKNPSDSIPKTRIMEFPLDRPDGAQPPREGEGR